MNKKSNIPTRRPPIASRTVLTRQEHILIEVSWLYYHDGLNQNEIAKRMELSRATVVNYLNETRNRDWVRVHLDSDVFSGHNLANELCDAYGLSKSLVVPDDEETTTTSARVIRVAAEWLPQLLESGDSLGVSWGETIYQVAQKTPYKKIKNLSVVQLLGSRPAALGFAAETCTSILAQKLGAQCLNLHVPLLLSNKTLRDQLCQESVVATQLEALKNCNKTLLACGICSPDAHVVSAGILSKASITKYRKNGAVGVICGRLIDAQGISMATPVENRMIGVSLEQMKNKDMSLLVVTSIERAVAARATILGGYATHLATSARVARRLLELAP